MRRLIRSRTLLDFATIVPIWAAAELLIDYHDGFARLGGFLALGAAIGVRDVVLWKRRW